jgi:mRNA-degrading endonuclease RelE of RelBE toxin-antitoxin system
MLFIETPTFTKLLTNLIDDDSYSKLQENLVLNPEIGNLIPGAGGLRKIRWKLPGIGKRSGIRIIYYWKVKEEQIIFLLIYPKNVQDDMTDKQLKILNKILKEELN